MFIFYPPFPVINNTFALHVILINVQLEYAALDAAVLIHIFLHVRGQSQPTGVPNEHTQMEWKSHIVRCILYVNIFGLVCSPRINPFIS